MRKLILVGSNAHYHFSNPDKDSENEVFTDKLAGVKLAVEYVHSDCITKCNALDLIEQIIKKRDLPITFETDIDQLEVDEAALGLIRGARAIVKRMSLTETLNDLPKFMICDNCGDHGYFVGHEFTTSDFRYKTDAYECVDELFGEGKIDKKDKENLCKQISDSKLPKNKVDMPERLN
jgi:hypothetical protein